MLLHPLPVAAGHVERLSLGIYLGVVHGGSYRPGGGYKALDLLGRPAPLAQPAG